MTRSEYKPTIDSSSTSDIRIGVVVAQWNEEITSRLLSGCLEGLGETGILQENVYVVRCPGSFEIPVLASHFVASGKVDGVIAIGVIIKGDTAHFEYVAEPVAHALQDIATNSGVPIGFCILTTFSEDQAVERAGGVHGNKGHDAALTVVETIQAIRRISDLSS
jgi:6,7-dimethyl-8-ribityllumazine synthase